MCCPDLAYSLGRGKGATALNTGKTVIIVVSSIKLFSYSSFQPVLHDWCNKGRGMCYPVYGMVHIKRTLAVN